MRFILGFVLGSLIFGMPAFSGNIPAPSRVQDKEIADYLRRISDNWMNLPSVTTNPNGSQQGRYGDIVLLSTGGNYYLEVCISTGPTGGTSWRGVQLTAVP